ARCIGMPVPQGAVCATKEAAFAAITPMLDEGRCVIVKQDYLSGGRGNEVLSPREIFRPIGARRVAAAPNHLAVSDYLEQRFDAITGGGRNRFVVEEYFRDSRAFFAEFVIDDAGSRLAGTGVLL